MTRAIVASQPDSGVALRKAASMTSALAQKPEIGGMPEIESASTAKSDGEDADARGSVLRGHEDRTPAGPRDRAGTKEEPRLDEHRMHCVEDRGGLPDDDGEREPHH